LILEIKENDLYRRREWLMGNPFSH
jgi:hypothetical protein